MDAQFLARFPAGTTAAQAKAFLDQADQDKDLAIALAQSATNTPPPIAAGQRSAGRSSNARRGNEYFVGGSANSGQAVVAPDNDSNLTDAIEGVFAKARANGARDTTQEFVSGSSVQAFAGVGRRLGHLPGQSLAMQPTKRFERRIRITFYQNGFQIEDGPLRSLTDDAGNRFLDSINRGMIPRELVAEFGDVDLSVDLVDRREEDFVPPAPPAYVAFAGTGHSLAATTSSDAPSTVIQGTGSAPPEAPAVDLSDETCDVLIVLLNGKRCSVKVNPKRHTVGHIRRFAWERLQKEDTPQNAAATFDMMLRDVPPRLLLNDGESVEAAKLRNATVMLKRK
mmetsp:Transcript_55800/g.64085  ORF Transcript_55800/g.64085 Transcript_55800/m.64085 type:complete len:339 (+) Transcript_55800:32-1048(+)